MFFLFCFVAAAVFFIWCYFSIDASLTLFAYNKFLYERRQKLQGKTIWITGASSGIGECVTYELASLGAKLILSARRKGELERVKEACIAKYGSAEDSIKILPLDIREHKSHSEAVSKALSLSGGRIDVLINNAGRYQAALITETELEVGRELLETNTLGTISLTTSILPHMIKQKSGHIVAITSFAGVVGLPTAASYVASKHALQGWFNTLRMEMMLENIDITLVCPGPVDSELQVNALSNTAGSRVGSSSGNMFDFMKTKRCTSLIVTAVANRFREVWISLNPALLYMYLVLYCPLLTPILTWMFGHMMLSKFKASQKRM
eukprot:m.16863 g.16863  ORF g.16863 m.16863 type:complete len:322 (+) comp27178_c0_seq2:155-1120(+)